MEAITINLNVAITLHAVPDPNIHAALGRIENALAAQKIEGEQLMSVLDDKITALTTAVENETSVEQSAVKLILGIPDLIGQAVATALAQGATSAQLQSLTDLQAKIASNSADLAAAVTANTPAEA